MATLHEGHAFGELALIENNGKRNATIITETACSLIILKKKDFDKCLRKIEQKANDILIDFVSQVPSFQGIGRGVISKIVKSLNKIEYMRGQIVSYENLADLVKFEEQGQKITDAQL